MNTYYKPLDAWMDSIEQERDMLGHEDRQRIIRDMRDNTAVRDALIATMFTDERAHDRNVINGLINAPRSSGNVKLMCTMIGNDFHKPVDATARRRADAIINLLRNNIDAMTGAGDDERRRAAVVPQLAVKAYVEWFTNRDEDGLRDASEALSLDEGYSLAALVLNVCGNHIRRGIE